MWQPWHGTPLRRLPAPVDIATSLGYRRSYEQSPHSSSAESRTRRSDEFTSDKRQTNICSLCLCPPIRRNQAARPSRFAAGLGSEPLRRPAERRSGPERQDAGRCALRKLLPGAPDVGRNCQNSHRVEASSKAGSIVNRTRSGSPKSKLNRSRGKDRPRPLALMCDSLNVQYSKNPSRCWASVSTTIDELVQVEPECGV